MSKKIVRESKYRHITGEPYKKQDCYENVRLTQSTHDSTFCSVNPKFLAIICEVTGGGAFLVLPLQRTGRIDHDEPLVVGHKAPVLEVAWCTHDDNLVASSSEDGTIKIWKIPDHGLEANLTEPFRDLCAHQRKVTTINWHPTAYLVLLSASADNKIIIWDVDKSSILNEITSHTDSIFSAVWNLNGSEILTTCKDKQIRVFDARSGQILKETAGHSSQKSMKALFLKDGRIFTVGFSSTAQREYALWDENLNLLMLENIDNSNGIIMPFYDEDINVLYLCGKGDSMVRFYEYVAESPPYIYFLNSYSSPESQRGMSCMPKRALNISLCEIAR
jgi:coronin-1B/1C/6